jgi:hypothetical protein
MKRQASGELNRDDDYLEKIGANAIRLLNAVPLHSESYLDLLSRLTNGVDRAKLGEVLSHGTPDNLRKCLKKAATMKLMRARI